MTDHDNKDNPADWDACDIHESTYPRGGVCPECCHSDDIAQIPVCVECGQKRGHLIGCVANRIAALQEANTKLRGLLRVAVCPEKCTDFQVPPDGHQCQFCTERVQALGDTE
jgi:hypothetical protein